MDIELSGIFDHNLLNIIHGAHDQVVAVKEGPKITQKLAAIVLFHQRVQLECGFDEVQSNAQQRQAILHCTDEDVGVFSWRVDAKGYGDAGKLKWIKQDLARTDKPDRHGQRLRAGAPARIRSAFDGAESNAGEHPKERMSADYCRMMEWNSEFVPNCECTVRAVVC